LLRGRGNVETARGGAGGEEGGGNGGEELGAQEVIPE